MPAFDIARPDDNVVIVLFGKACHGCSADALISPANKDNCFVSDGHHISEVCFGLDGFGVILKSVINRFDDAKLDEVMLYIKLLLGAIDRVIYTLVPSRAILTSILIKIRRFKSGRYKFADSSLADSGFGHFLSIQTSPLLVIPALDFACRVD